MIANGIFDTVYCDNKRGVREGYLMAKLKEWEEACFGKTIFGIAMELGVTTSEAKAFVKEQYGCTEKEIKEMCKPWNLAYCPYETGEIEPLPFGGNGLI